MKINLQILKLIYNDCSSNEIDFCLYLSRLQNDFGHIRGINYKQTCLDLNLCKASFYNLILSLEDKGILIVDWSNSRNWNFTFANNVFNKPNTFTAGYLNTNRDFLHSNDFRNLKANEKKLILKLLVCLKQNSSFNISFSKLMQWVGIDNITLLYNYLESLGKWFDITFKKNKYYFKLKEISETAKNSEIEIYLIHKIRSFCSIYNICYTDKDLKDLIILFKQYSGKKLMELLRAINESIDKYRTIEPKFINYMISKY